MAEVSWKLDPELRQRVSRTRRWAYIQAVMTGLLLWLGLLVWPTFIWVALVPLSSLILSSRTHRLIRLPDSIGGGTVFRSGLAPRHLYGAAYLGGFVFAFFSTWWVWYCHPSAWLGWLTLSAYLALYFPFYIYFCRILYHTWKLPLLFAIPIVWVALEYARVALVGGLGFGWFYLGHALYLWPSWLQLADVGGVYAVSFLIALVNAAFVEVLTLPQPLVVTATGQIRPSGSLLWRVGLTSLALVGNLVYGIVRLQQEVQFQAGPTVVLVHSVVAQSLRNESAHEATDQMVQLTRQAMPRPGNLVIWPETSFQGFTAWLDDSLTPAEVWQSVKRRFTHWQLEPNETAEQRGAQIRQVAQLEEQDLKQLASQINKSLLIGTTRYDIALPQAKRHNSSVLVTPERGYTAYYDKHHLVPFGEYIPLQDWLPLQWLTPYEAGMDVNTDPSLLPLPLQTDTWRLGILICFEDTLPHLSRTIVQSTSADEPIQMLVNQSNDGWFRGSVEADLHLAAALFRAIECRTPLVRSTNMGVTAIIDGNGKILDRHPKREPGLLVGQVPLDPRQSLYLTYGDWLPQLCLVIVLVGFMLAVVHAFQIAVQRVRNRLAEPTESQPAADRSAGDAKAKETETPKE